MATLSNSLATDSKVILPDSDFHQGYRNIFTATPKDVPWRPPLDYPKTRLYGSQTAKVVGPKGQEIYCDEYGSVKVQFHWDREGQFDENSSCWVRVGSNWAHKGYGTFTIPRIGMEAVISFLEGDPDQPVITGCINNGINTQAEAMPANKTKTGFKTNSSPGGGGSNELTFEDKKGEEQIYIHAQKDMNTVVENNESLSVGVNRTKDIGQDENVTIGRIRERVVRKTDILKVGESKLDQVASVYEMMAGEYLRLVCGKTAIDLFTDGTLNITCEKFNIFATNTGEINTKNGVLDLNYGEAEEREAFAEATKETKTTINKDVESYFGGGGGGEDGSTVEQDQQDAVIPQNLLNESGATAFKSENDMPPTANLLPTNTPATPADAPKEVNLSSMQGTFNQLWGSSFPNGKSQEFGGTIVNDIKSCEYSILNTGGGNSGSFSPNLNVPNGKEVMGVFHTHPYDKTEGLHTGVSLSGGDAGYFINKQQAVIIAQSGTDQFMYMRTAQTPSQVDYNVLNNAQNNRISELMTNAGKSFSEASKQAAAETATNHGLAYYEGSNGKLTRVTP